MESERQCTNIQNNGLEGYEANAPSSVLQDSRHLSKVENAAYLHSSFPCSNPVNEHDCEEGRRISDDSLIEGPSTDDNARCQSASNYFPDRKLGQNHSESSIKGTTVIPGEEYEAFNSIFEGGSLQYCHMSFEALLNVRKQLEDLGFPCKTVNDGLWLQMLLSHRVQETAVNTCISCCATMTQCTCRLSYGYYKQEHGRNNGSQTLRNMYMTDAQGEGNAYFAPVRVQVRGPIDGLAGIGRGTWTPTRLVFSRVPLGVGNRNGHQSVANDESESRVSSTADLSGDGLTALVGLRGERGALPVHAEQSDAYEIELQGSLRTVPQFPSASGLSMQMMEAPEGDLGIRWEDSDASSVSWDLKTALRHFPPFRFGVEFEDVHRLADGQVKHSPEAFYAGSLWKVSVQAFSNEYPQGRRTVGLFLHRRRAEALESLKKAHMYVDSREKVTARYQLICPSKREVMVFGSFKDSGTLLPKAPKGWGWRTALLFDELPDLLQGGALRVVAVVQLV